MHKISKFLLDQSRTGLKPTEVLNFLKKTTVDPESLKKHLIFKPENYTRNLIFKNEDFEMLLLCWEPGQATRIHDHASQGCWMSVLDGIITSENYDFVSRKDFNGNLRRSSCESFVKGEAYYIDDSVSLHLLRNPIKNNTRTLTLHIYSKPFSKCTIYDLEKRTVSDLELSYDSMMGKPGYWLAGQVKNAG